MKLVLKRSLAYFLDALLIGMFSILLNTTPLNINSDKYEKKYEEYNKISEHYTTFLSKITDLNGESKISEGIINGLYDNYPEYTSNLNKAFKDKKLSNNEYKKLYKNCMKDYEKNYNHYSYILVKYSISNLIISIVISILYFGVFQYIAKGQTFGKRIMKIQVTSANEKHISMINYIIRSILVSGVFADIIYLVSVFIIHSDTAFGTIYRLVGVISYIFMLTLIVTVNMLKDNRGLHDLILNTKVIDLDNNIDKKVKEAKYIEKGDK